MEITSNKLHDRDVTEFTATEIRGGKLFESRMSVPGHQLRMQSKEEIVSQLYANLKEVSAEELQQRRDYIKSVIADAMEGT